MARVFSYRSDIPATCALSVIRILQGRSQERNFEILQQYEAQAVIAWVQTILDDNGCHEPPMGEIGWWKSKLLGN